MNKDIFCPACGSSKVEEIKSTEFRQLTLGSQFEVTISNYHCAECGEEGDFGMQNDSSITFLTKEAQKEFVKLALDELDKKLPLVGIERSLELPFRTLNRWKSGDFSATSLVLLRILKTYPWIIDVADEKFSEKASAVYMLNAATTCFSKSLSSKNLGMDVSIQNKPGAVTAKIKIFGTEAAPSAAFYSGRPKVEVGG